MVMERNSKLVQTLEQGLDAEIALYKEHGRVMAREQQALIAFRDEEVAQCVSQREGLANQIELIHQTRLDCMQHMPGYMIGLRLTELMPRVLHPQDCKRLTAKAQELKKIAHDSRRSSGEFEKLLQFTLNMVSSLMSIIWSASQHVFRSYGRSGQIKESYQPARSVASNTIKKA